MLTEQEEWFYNGSNKLIQFVKTHEYFNLKTGELQSRSSPIFIFSSREMKITVSVQNIASQIHMTNICDSLKVNRYAFASILKLFRYFIDPFVEDSMNKFRAM
jgi:hypothetical protein